MVTQNKSKIADLQTTGIWIKSFILIYEFIPNVFL
jgi:hypothetical protein